MVLSLSLTPSDGTGDTIARIRKVPRGFKSRHQCETVHTESQLATRSNVILIFKCSLECSNVLEIINVKVFLIQQNI